MTNITKNDLDIGEEVCPACKGTGEHLVDFPVINPTKGIPERMKINFVCEVCLGKGKLDWIEKITGVKQIL